MRILMINQFFWPDIAPTGQYLSDLARHLAGEGHDVTVICSRQLYSQSEVDGQEPPPVRVIRVFGAPFKRSSLSRMLSYASFLSGALWHCFRVPRPEMVLTMTTPPLLSLAGTMLKLLRGTRHFIWEMDMFPDALVTTGLLPARSILVRCLSRVQKASQRRSDGIIALGPCMRARLLAAGIPADLVHVAENWADGRVIASQPNRLTGPIHILYSGNLGMAHDIDTVADALRYFRNDSRFLFSFAGGGTERAKLQRMCEAAAIENVHFLPYANREAMSAHLSQADIGLVTELPACIGTVVPSKVYGLLAAGRPVLFVGPGEATPGFLIDRFACGWQINPGDSRALIALLEHLATNRDETVLRGQRAREVFDLHYDLPRGVARVAAALGLGPIEDEPLWNVAPPQNSLPLERRSPEFSHEVPSPADLR